MLVKFNLIDREKNKISIEVEEGITIREAIMEKLKPGNFGLCEGNNICATCHVYVDEKETMETNDIDQKEFSRLSCQIELKQKLEDITVTMEIPRR